MKPYIICHMMSSVDGRIDCAMTEQIDPTDAYYVALDALKCDATLEGRVTKQIHYALPQPFEAHDKTSIGKEAFHKATPGPHYDVAVDTHGSLRWPETAASGNLLVVTSCDCPKEYHDYLTANNISRIATGDKSIDLKRAAEMLCEQFGVKRLAVVGGGNINGAFLRAGLIDEVSLMVGGGIDGRRGMTAVFDGIDAPDYPVTLLDLKDVTRMGNTVWMRYDIRR